MTISEPEKVVDFPASAQTGTLDDAFLLARQRIEDCLIQYTLLDSYRKFCDAGLGYPFIEAERVFPEKDNRSAEMHPQHAALVFLLDCPLPRSLNKYFRLRASNRVTWRNLLRLLPDEDHDNFKAAHCRVDSKQFPGLFRKLLLADYALLIEQERDMPAPTLSHLHVKVERLTDSALREVGKQLGYIDRSLFERGEDYVEELEAKFFEYHGFSANASGRKSAAAIAAQLFAKNLQRYSVFVTSQTDNRLTHLHEGDRLSQHFLVRLDSTAQQQLSDQLDAANIVNLDGYAVDRFIDGAVVARMQVDYRRTSAARPAEQRAKEKDLARSWITIESQRVWPFRAGLPALQIDWAADANS